MKMLTKLRKDKKGFTLIEIVIVLVIIAILAAMLVPSMMGWIDDSRKKSFLTEARSAMTASQAELATAYAANKDISGWTSFTNEAGYTPWANIEKKTGVLYTSTNIKFKIEEGQIATFTYNNGVYTSTWDNVTKEWSDPVDPSTTTTAAG